MGARPRLLLCIGEVLAHGGQSRVVTREIESLREQFDVTLVVDRMCADTRVPVETVVLGSVGPWRDQHAVFRSLARAADVIHCHDSLRFMWWSSRAGRPWIVTSHGIAPLRYRPGLSSAAQGAVTMAAYPRLYRKATAVVAISDFIAAWLRRMGVSRVSVIRNGAPGLVAGDGRVPLQTDLLYIGEVSRRKGISDLVRMARVLPETCTITVVGSGPMGGYLAAQSGRTSSARVRYLGAVSDATVDALLSSAFCTVSASYWEGFGLPIVEGFAHGRPALVRRTSGMAELVDASGGGALFDSPEEAPDKVQWMQREWKDLSNLASAYAASWSWENAMAEYGRLLSEALGVGVSRSMGRNDDA